MTIPGKIYKFNYPIHLFVDKGYLSYERELESEKPFLFLEKKTDFVYKILVAGKIYLISMAKEFNGIEFEK